MRERESAGDLQGQLDRPIRRQRSLTLDQPLQRLALDILEDDEVALAAIVNAVDSLTVTMFGCVKLRDRACLLIETLAT